VAGYAGTRAPDRPESGLLESGGDRSLERVELEEKGVERGAVRRRADKAPHPIEAHDIVFLEQGGGFHGATCGSAGAVGGSSSRPSGRVRHRQNGRRAFGGDRIVGREHAAKNFTPTVAVDDAEIVSRGRGRRPSAPSLPRRNRSEAVGVGSGWIVIGTRKSGTAHWINATGRFDECDSIQGQSGPLWPE